jgi:hypothetical protein
MPLRSSMYQHPIKPPLFRVRVPHANTGKGSVTYLLVQFHAV